MTEKRAFLFWQNFGSVYQSLVWYWGNFDRPLCLGQIYLVSAQFLYFWTILSRSVWRFLTRKNSCRWYLTRLQVYCTERTFFKTSCAWDWFLIEATLSNLSFVLKSIWHVKIWLQVRKLLHRCKCSRHSELFDGAINLWRAEQISPCLGLNARLSAWLCSYCKRIAIVFTVMFSFDRMVSFLASLTNLTLVLRANLNFQNVSVLVVVIWSDELVHCTLLVDQLFLRVFNSIQLVL